MDREVILASAKELQSELVRIRRELHRHPEISGQEERTAAFLLQELNKIGGYEIRTNVAGHGILAELQGTGEGKQTMIALRADMDALAIREETDLPYTSENDGVMHACGHDNHMTMLLGAAMLLKKHQDQYGGRVRLIFQPAEERSPIGGSRGMIQEGALENADAVFGVHVWPGAPLGSFGTKPGPLMAASDHFTIRLKGASSHGAEPHNGTDTVAAGAQIVSALQTVISRNKDPLKGGVLTVGRFQAGTRYNIIAEECELEGTCRTLDPEIRDLCEQRVAQIAKGIGEAMGCQVEINWERGYLATINDAKQAEYMLSVAANLFGEEAAVKVDTPSMCAEDFSFYLAEKPGAFGWVGTGEEGKTVWPLHSCHYAPNEDALWRGAAFMAQLAMEF